MKARQRIFSIAAAGLVATLLPTSSASASLAAPTTVDDAATFAAGSPTVVDVLANDTSAGVAVLTLAADGQSGAPLHGSVTVTSVLVGGISRAALSYTPDAGWYGSDWFGYRLTDESALSDSAVVAVTVTPLPPIVGPDVASVAPADSVRVTVLDNDTDPYGLLLTVTAVTSGTHGAIVGVASGRAITYAPAVGRSGADTVAYTVLSASGATARGTVTITTLPSSPGHVATLSAPAAVIVLRHMTLTGAVDPHGDVLPTVAIQSLEAAGWVTSSTVQPSELGSFSADWAPDKPGTVLLRALAIWADGTSATSPTVTTAVVGSADPVVSVPLTRSAVLYSYRSGCPVAPQGLRRLSVNFWDYSGHVRRGSIVLAPSAVAAVRSVFTAAFTAPFRIKAIGPVEVFYRSGTVSPTQSDINAMNAGNTSAFNCRTVTGSRYRVSQHSYGNAIDVNTFENPYATSSKVYPVAAAYRYYAMRRYHLRDTGVIAPNSLISRAFAAQRWLWGARWTRHDYQHFSANGG